MKLITVKTPDAASVGAGQTAVFTLPIGRTYHNLQLVYSGVTLAQINAVRLRGNGQILMELGTGAELDSRNKFDGLEAAAGILRINFERESLHDVNQRFATVIGTGWKHPEGDIRQNLELKTLQLEVDIDAGAVGTALSMYAQQSPSQPLGLVRRIRKVTVSGASGENQITNLPRNTTTDRAINRIIIKSANLTNLRVTKDQYEIFNRTKALNERFQLDGWRVPQSGYVVLDSTENALGSNVIEVHDAQDFQVLPTLSAGETLTLFVEYLGIL